MTQSSGLSRDLWFFLAAAGLLLVIGLSEYLWHELMGF
jgi:hypothetical protein